MCPLLLSFGHTPRHPAPHPVRSARRACLVSSADRCSVTSVRACVPCAVCCGRSALHLARPALLSVVCISSGCAGGWGLHLWGIWREPGVGRSTPRVEKIQKRCFSAFLLPTPTPSSQNETSVIVQVSKNFPQKQKDPYKGPVLCAILALQALKGRNL